jgi:alkylation response protein AidB-like acyl-CoA dehydrogenase
MDLVELAGAGDKQLFMTTPLVETERFKEGLARLDADLMAARALLEAQITHVWHNPGRPAAKDLARAAEQLQEAIWITSTCVRVAEGCFELAGSRTVYESSSPQWSVSGWFTEGFDIGGQLPSLLCLIEVRGECQAPMTQTDLRVQSSATSPDCC